MTSDEGAVRTKLGEWSRDAHGFAKLAHAEDAAGLLLKLLPEILEDAQRGETWRAVRIALDAGYLRGTLDTSSHHFGKLIARAEAQNRGRARAVDISTDELRHRWEEKRNRVAETVSDTQVAELVSSDLKKIGVTLSGRQIRNRLKSKDE